MKSVEAAALQLLANEVVASGRKSEINLIQKTATIIKVQKRVHHPNLHKMLPALKMQMHL